MRGATLVRLGNLLCFQTRGQKLLIRCLLCLHSLLRLINCGLLLLLRLTVEGRYPQLDEEVNDRRGRDDAFTNN